MKTWRDVEEAALHEPLLYQLVALVARGEFTREQALIQAVLGLVAAKEMQRQAIVDLLNTRPRPALIVVRTETTRQQHPFRDNPREPRYCAVCGDVRAEHPHS